MRASKLNMSEGSPTHLMVRSPERDQHANHCLQRKQGSLLSLFHNSSAPLTTPLPKGAQRTQIIPDHLSSARTWWHSWSSVCQPPSSDDCDVACLEDACPEVARPGECCLLSARLPFCDRDRASFLFGRCCACSCLGCCSCRGCHRG